ncbi:hypothetical protein [Moorena sp. SIO3H5]|uniref:hypothetical protein n=1 Tax=Moorena sp. SIO3H5 TaxID=2607834 RepID=UPI0013BAB471|nr:hypothetical protein [Moorena sp. SIO3H5]NEO71861.1 hypothetical protein [Moorena sp. SIO3H5]
MGSSSTHWNSRGIYYDDLQVLDLALTPCLDAVAHGGNQRQLLMGGTPKTALPPQDRAASLNFWGGFPPLAKGKSDPIRIG